MMLHAWTVVCSLSIIDRNTNNVSLVNVVEQIIMEPPPAEIPNEQVGIPLTLSFVSLWSREKPRVGEVGRARLVFVGPDDKEIVANETAVDLGSHDRTRTIFSVAAFPFRGFGRYTVVTEQRGEQEESFRVVSRVPIELSSPATAMTQ